MGERRRDRYIRFLTTLLVKIFGSGQAQLIPTSSDEGNGKAYPVPKMLDLLELFVRGHPRGRVYMTTGLRSKSAYRSFWSPPPWFHVADAFPNKVILRYRKALLNPDQYILIKRLEFGWRVCSSIMKKTNMQEYNTLIVLRRD